MKIPAESPGFVAHNPRIGLNQPARAYHQWGYFPEYPSLAPQPHARAQGAPVQPPNHPNAMGVFPLGPALWMRECHYQ